MPYFLSLLRFAGKTLYLWTPPFLRHFPDAPQTRDGGHNRTDQREQRVPMMVTGIVLPKFSDTHHQLGHPSQASFAVDATPQHQ